MNRNDYEMYKAEMEFLGIGPELEQPLITVDDEDTLYSTKEDVIFFPNCEPQVGLTLCNSFNQLSGKEQFEFDVLPGGVIIRKKPKVGFIKKLVINWLFT